MGHSHWKNKKPIRNYLRQQIAADTEDPIRILDLGMGSGDVGKYLKKQIDGPMQLMGVEVWEKNR